MSEATEKSMKAIRENGQHLSLLEYNDYLRALKEEIEMLIEASNYDLEKEG